MSMKSMALVFLLFIVMFGVVLMAYSQLPQSKNPVIVKDDVILEKGPGDYMEVRHIVVRGTNEAIGRALGDIAQKEYGARLDRYTSPLNGRARREYITANYPILWERMKGVAGSYGIDPYDGTYDTGSLAYGIGPAGCSIIFFPGNRTDNGHAIYSRNMDYFIVTASEIFGTPPSTTSGKMCSKNYVLEIYPDRGYSSIVIGSFDLLNGPLDGMNERGVTVSLLVDNDIASATVKDPDRVSGLSTLQLMRAVLDTAADVDEAKLVILNNTVSMVAVPLHALVADRTGRSFVAEMSDTDSRWRFTENAGKPQILTNHAVYKYPDTGTFPAVPAEDEYDSFNRYRRLDAFVSTHNGTFSVQDASDVMSLVYAHTDLGIEGGSRPLPMRTVWTSVFDLEDQSVLVSFYIKDGTTDPPAQGPGLVFSQPFLFRLGSTGP
jgi:predicted choloylglycine hydrolase